jgi:hypothetical protein
MGKVITVKELAYACKAEIEKGNGDKKILLSSDDEGNEFHEMFFLFTPADGYFDGPCTPIAPKRVVDNPEEYIILG